MYSIDGLCPNGNPMGGHGFYIHLSPQFRDAVKASGYTQEHIDRVVTIYGREWLQKCGFSHYFDPENCGFGAVKHAIPSENTKPNYGNAMRITWGEWGIEHIDVPGNACGLDIDRSSFACSFRGGRTLVPHNIDSWAQVMSILVAFTWIANSVIVSASVAESDATAT